MCTTWDRNSTMVKVLKSASIAFVYRGRGRPREVSQICSFQRYPRYITNSDIRAHHPSLDLSNCVSASGPPWPPFWEYYCSKHFAPHYLGTIKGIRVWLGKPALWSRQRETARESQSTSLLPDPIGKVEKEVRGVWCVTQGHDSSWRPSGPT